MFSFAMKTKKAYVERIISIYGLLIYAIQDVIKHCVQKQHPLTFSFISPCIISRFKGSVDSDKCNKKAVLSQ